MKCDNCEKCKLHPRQDLFPGKCIYFGPFHLVYEYPPDLERHIARSHYGVGRPENYRTKPDAETIREVQEWAKSHT